MDKIEGPSPHRPEIRQAPQPAARQTDARTTGPAASTGKANADQFELTESGKLLQSLQAKVDQSDGFDRAKVDEIKQSIANGDYRIDAERIADAVTRLEDQL